MNCEINIATYAINHSTMIMVLRLRRNRARSDGMTLLEVMIAVVIFAMVAASGFICLRMGMVFVDNSRHQTRASQMMQSHIETLRSLPWGKFLEEAGAETGAETEVFLEQAVSDQYANINYADYTVKRTITAGTGDSKKITMVAEWTGIDGRSRTRSYVTLYARGGLYDYIR